MTVEDKLSKDIPLLIEGGKATKSRALNMNEMLDKLDYELVEANEPVESNGLYQLN